MCIACRQNSQQHYLTIGLLRTEYYDLAGCNPTAPPRLLPLTATVG